MALRPGCRAGKMFCGRRGRRPERGKRMKHFLKRHAGACFLAAFTAAGLAFGLGYYFAVGCALGACPITSNPAASALYGGVMGFLLGNILLPQRWTVRKKADGAEK